MIRIPFCFLLFAAWMAGNVRAAGDERAQAPLFDGKTLDGWSVHAAQTKGENPGVFTMQDGMLRVSGGSGSEEILGGLISKREFSNYRLSFEYRWGGPTYGGRKNAARDSGVLLHCTGPGGPGPWPAAVECQILEGATGDVVLIGGNGADGKPVVHRATARATKLDGQYYFDPAGPRVTLAEGQIHRRGRDRHWKDVLGFRGLNDLESPTGEWTHVECTAKGDSLEIAVNGRFANRVVGLALTKGRILLLSEGAEVWYRNVELTPLE